MENTNEKMGKLLTIDEAAELLNVSDMTVRRLIKDKQLLAAKIGRQWRIKEKEIEFMVDKKSTTWR